MMNNKSVHQAEKLTDAELSKKLGRYQFMRKYYVASLERMGSLLDILDKSPSFFGD